MKSKLGTAGLRFNTLLTPIFSKFIKDKGSTPCYPQYSHNLLRICWKIYVLKMSARDTLLNPRIGFRFRVRGVLKYNILDYSTNMFQLLKVVSFFEFTNYVLNLKNAKVGETVCQILSCHHVLSHKWNGPLVHYLLISPIKKRTGVIWEFFWDFMGYVALLFD